MAVILGGGTSRFIVAAVGGDSPGAEFTVDLPLTNKPGGLVESYNCRMVQHELIGLNPSAPTIERTKPLIIGEDIAWTFNYAAWVLGETLMKLNQIYQAAKAQRDILLIPRINNLDRFFEIHYAGEPFDVGIGPGGVNARRNTLPIFKVVTAKTEPDRKWSLIIPGVTSAGGGSVFQPIEGGM